MNKRLLVVPLILILALILVGCSSKPSVGESAGYPPAASGTVTRNATAYPGFAPAPTTLAPSYGSKDGYSGGQSSAGVTNSPDRMVVRTGNIQLVVKDIATTLDNIVKIAADNGGYVVTSQKWKDSQRDYGSISIRVLTENYDKTVSVLRSLAISVTSETTSSQDVTQEYTDLNSQLTNLQATEAQLLKIMETATKVEDVLAVQSQLTTVRGNIEQIKGRMLYLERTSSTSLIDINLTESVFGLKFSADKVRVDTNQKVTFSPEIDGGFAPFSYLWDFGDGEQSTEVSPQHTYIRGGDYTVVLTVTDDKGYNNQAIRQSYINVLNTWNAGSVAGSAWNAVKVFAKVVANVLIWILTFAPVWIIAGAIVWFCIYWKRRKARKAAEKKS
jgi:PKD repeat protein